MLPVSLRCLRHLRCLRSTLPLSLFFSLFSVLPWAPATAQEAQEAPDAKKAHPLHVALDVVELLRLLARSRTAEAYEILSMPTAITWDYKGVENRYLFTADNLRVAMTLNPDLKVFVASGTFDLVTTALSARYVLDHLDIDPALRKNLTFAEYPGGHMMYLHEPSLARLKNDLAAFYESATARTR